MAKEQGSTDPATTGGDTTDKTVTSQTAKPAAKKAAAPRRSSAKSAGLTAGEEASKDVFLKMQGGYGEDYLVPGEPADGQPGVLLVQKGDTVTYGAVRSMERAEENAARLKKG